MEMEKENRIKEESTEREELLERIRTNPSILKDRKVPEDIENLAVRMQWNNLKYIADPRESTKLEAVRNKGWAIQYIENPSEELKMEAVRRDPDSIEYIKDPSLELQLAAVEGNWNAIKYIKEPAREVRQAAVLRNEQAIGYIRNMDSEDVGEFIRSNIRVLKYIYDSVDMDELERILKDKFSGDPGYDYIKDFYELKVLDMDKIRFVRENGSRKTQMYLADYILGR